VFLFQQQTKRNETKGYSKHTRGLSAVVRSSLVGRQPTAS